jgi:tetratricopeptide (TPR) repeat protein
MHMAGKYRLDHEMRLLQVKCARVLGDRPAELAALWALARASDYLGRADEAAQYSLEALALARELGDRVQIISLLSSLGDKAVKRGARAEAERQYDEANTLARELGEQLTEVNALSALGFVAEGVGRPDEAEQWFRRAIERGLATGNPDARHALEGLGFLFDELDDVAAAQATFEVIVAIQRAVLLDMPRGGPLALNALGQLALKAGDLETASRDLTEALALSEGRGMTDTILQVHGNLALLAGLQAQRRGERGAAEQAFEEALRWFEQSGGNANATDQRPYARHLLAELRELTLGNPPPTPSVPAEVSEARIRFVHQLLVALQVQAPSGAPVPASPTG